MIMSTATPIQRSTLPPLLKITSIRWELIGQLAQRLLIKILFFNCKRAKTTDKKIQKLHRTQQKKKGSNMKIKKRKR